MISQVVRFSRRPVALFGLLAVVTLGATMPACNRLSGSSAAKDDLSLVPKETAAIFMVNLKQARSSKVFQKIIEARDKDPNSAKEYKEFVQRCSIDPMNDIDNLLLAVPSDTQQSREYALIMRGRYQPEAIAACARKNAEQHSQTLNESEYNGVKIYTTGERNPHLAVLGKRAVVMAGPAWMRRVIDLSAGKVPASESARDNKELGSMMSRTRTGDAFWFAGQVPPSMADRLRASPKLGAAASLHSISGSVDIAKGLAVHADLDLGSDADATALNTAVTGMLGELRQDSRLQMMGMTSYLDTLQVGAKKSTFVADIKMTDQQLDDLTTRLSGLARSLPF